jgi:hypothetical protein
LRSNAHELVRKRKSFAKFLPSYKTTLLDVTKPEFGSAEMTLEASLRIEKPLQTCLVPFLPARFRRGLGLWYRDLYPLDIDFWIAKSLLNRRRIVDTLSFQLETRDLPIEFVLG